MTPAIRSRSWIGIQPREFALFLSRTGRGYRHLPQSRIAVRVRKTAGTAYHATHRPAVSKSPKIRRSEGVQGLREIAWLRNRTCEAETAACRLRGSAPWLQTVKKRFQRGVGLCRRLLLHPVTDAGQDHRSPEIRARCSRRGIEVVAGQERPHRVLFARDEEGWLGDHRI